MHNPTIYRATFRDLIMTAFDKEQTIKLRIELTMYQASDCPERWTFTPTLPTGRPHMEARSPVELARLIEGCFVHRETDWMPLQRPPRQAVAAKPATNVVEMPRRRGMTL